MTQMDYFCKSACAGSRRTRPERSLYFNPMYVYVGSCNTLRHTFLSLVIPYGRGRTFR
jgi:hypothetical protein